MIGKDWKRHFNHRNLGSTREILYHQSKHERPLFCIVFVFFQKNWTLRQMALYFLSGIFGEFLQILSGAWRCNSWCYVSDFTGLQFLSESIYSCLIDVIIGFAHSHLIYDSEIYLPVVNITLKKWADSFEICYFLRLLRTSYLTRYKTNRDVENEAISFSTPLDKVNYQSFRSVTFQYTLATSPVASHLRFLELPHLLWL